MGNVIHRGKGSFTHVENTVFFDRSLSLKAKGIYCQLRSPEGNPEWVFTIRGFASLVRDGVDAVTAGIRELEEAGYTAAFPGLCMHEFVLTLEGLKKETGVSALDVAKSLIDYGMHPPTMYFPLIVHEALMLEPTETESKETLDWAGEVFHKLADLAREDPEFMHNAPHNAQIGRPDEVRAARNPVLRYRKA